MREIKFRAWDKKIKRMAFAFWVASTNGVVWRSNTEIQIEPTEYIPMQFTGLKDKKGNEIYEGDIARVEAHDINRGQLGPAKGIVEFEDYAFIVNVKNPYIISGLWKLFRFKRSIEVIGNIYENKNLLNNPEMKGDEII